MNLKLKHNLQFFSTDNGLFHVYDPTTMKHFKIGAQEAGWLKLLNGKNSKDTLKESIPEEFFEPFLEQIQKLGLIENGAAKKSFDLFKMKFRLFDINRTLARMGEYTVILRKFMKLSSVLFTLLSAFIVLRDFAAIREAAASFEFGYGMIGFYLGAILLIGFVHEFAHSIVAKSYGVNVPNIGIMLLYLHPAFYSDISGIQLLANKKERIHTLLSGIVTNNMLVAVALLLFHIVNSFAPEAAVYFLYFAIMNGVLIMMNLLPFVEYDGYYILVNLFDELNFKNNAKAYVQSFFKHKLYARELKLEYIFYYFISRLFTVALLGIAVVSLRNLLQSAFHSIYVDYACLAGLIALLGYFNFRNRRRNV